MDRESTTLLSTQDDSQLTEIIDALPIGLVMVDRDGQIMMTNRELENQFGYTGEEMLGRPVEMLLPQRYRHTHPGLRGGYFKQPRQRTMGSGRELFGLRKDGMEFPVEIGLNPVATAKGPAVIASVSDITVRKRLEANFRQVVEASPVGKLMVDHDGKIQLVNKKLCQLFGYRREELLGKNVEMLLPRPYRQAHIKMRRDFFAQPDTRAMGEGRDLSGLRKDGTEFAVEIGLSPLETESGMAVVAAITDISERKKMELNLRKLNEDLDEFTYVASHDLRAPLQSIASLAEWIEEDLGAQATPEVMTNIERIKVRITRMERLIDDLLDYARAGRSNSEFHEILVNSLIDDVVALIDIPAGFEIRVSSNTDSINAPLTPLETVLRNLIGNAVKHHDRDHGSIAISIRAENSMCVFEIEDDGPGIPEPEHERIFKLFHTLSANDHEHTGVGLAVSKRLVESYGGHIEIISRAGRRGTVFCLHWPLMVAER